MAVESAADLTSFFNQEEFAEAALYTAPEPGAYAEPCSVIVDRGQGRQRFDAGRNEASTQQRKVQVSSGDIEELVREGIFEILDENGVPTGEKLKVAGKPHLDREAGIWSAQVTIAN